jgi:C-terminal processing protease CtpA/Prc
MSSCEAFLLMMKQVPGCKSIGAKSYGSSGNPKPTDLGNGVTVYLPSWQSLRPDGTCFEGEGLAPDFPINATQVEFEAADPVLQAALTLLRRR